AQDLAEARSLAHDSVVATYKIDPATGLAQLDPKTGLPIPDTWDASRFTPDRIKARRTHYEDWIAAIIFNHLFSGADAYVAANLWDFRTNIGAVAPSRSVSLIPEWEVSPSCARSCTSSRTRASSTSATPHACPTVRRVPTRFCG